MKKKMIAEKRTPSVYNYCSSSLKEGSVQRKEDKMLYNLNIKHAVQLALEKDPHTPFYYKLQELTHRIKDYVSLFYSDKSENDTEEGRNRKTFFDQLSVGDNKRITQLIQEADQKKRRRNSSKNGSKYLEPQAYSGEGIEQYKAMLEKTPRYDPIKNN